MPLAFCNNDGHITILHLNLTGISTVQSLRPWASQEQWSQTQTASGFWVLLVYLYFSPISFESSSLKLFSQDPPQPLLISQVVTGSMSLVTAIIAFQGNWSLLILLQLPVVLNNNVLMINNDDNDDNDGWTISEIIILPWHHC